MQDTAYSVPPQSNTAPLPSVLSEGPEVIDPSMFRFIGGGLPKDGGWALVAATPSVVAQESLL